MRVFIAALLPEDIIAYLREYQESVKPLWEGIRWEGYEKFHITLKFLGNIEEDKASKVKTVMEDCIKGRKAFDVILKATGGFPNLKNPRVICYCLGCTSELEYIFHCIEEGLSSLGFPKEERPFKPHITAGRAKAKVRLYGSMPSLKPREFKIRELAVIRSELRPSGSIYTPISTYELPEI